MKKFKYKNRFFSFIANRYIRENDTYKNKDGEGILERFMQVCGEYLDDELTPDIDTLLDNLNPLTTDEYFINLIWEYYGFIPYAYGVMQDSKYYDKYELTQTLNRKDLKVDYRNLLKYAISLYKIRCTPLFYEVLGKFYGLEIDITEPTGDKINKSTVYDRQAYYNQESQYNQDIDCLECLELTVKVKILNENILSPKELENIKEGTVFILNKYLPLHIEELTTSSIIFTTVK